MKADVVRFNSVGPHRLEARRALIAITEAIGSRRQKQSFHRAT